MRTRFFLLTLLLLPVACNRQVVETRPTVPLVREILSDRSDPRAQAAPAVQAAPAAVNAPVQAVQFIPVNGVLRQVSYDRPTAYAEYNGKWWPII